MNHLALPTVSYAALAPILFLLLGGVALMVLSALSRRPLAAGTVTGYSVLIGFGALISALAEYGHVNGAGPSSTVASAIAVDGFSAAIAVTVSVVVILASLLSHGYLRRMQIDAPAYHVLALTSASGAIIMAAANDLVVLFLGLEILSIALYVLAALNRRSAKSEEAALKYFILGGFSSAIFLFGIAFTYGATGSTNLQVITRTLGEGVAAKPGLLLAGLGLLLVGFFFKVAAVPFHLWTPDVYEGAPTPVTGFMAAAAKVGGFAALLRVLLTAMSQLSTNWTPVVYSVAVATLIGGAVLMVVQRDAKRMLAYSSINHAGFLLVGIVAATSAGISADLFYLFTYSVTALATFGIVTMLAGPRDDDAGINRLSGLAHRHPAIGAAMAILLLAQAGVPFTTGFIAKFSVIEAVVGHGSIPLAIIAMASAAVAVFAYLRLVATLYRTEDVATVDLGYDDSLTDGPAAFAIGLSVVVTIFFGIFPAALLDFGRTAVAHLLP